MRSGRPAAPPPVWRAGKVGGSGSHAKRQRFAPERVSKSWRRLLFACGTTASRRREWNIGDLNIE